MNKNFDSIIFLAGKFGIVIREHVEQLIYTNKYSHISANRTLSKLVDSGILKRVDRGKRKTDGYKLTNQGIKYYKKNFNSEPKNYNSGDKLQHSIQIVNFYIHIINDIKKRYNIEEINLLEEKRLIMLPEKQLKFVNKDKIETIIPDSFIMYKYKSDRARVVYLEIENSERKAPYVAQKTLNNYERYYLSSQWKKERWQKKNAEIFPYILIVAYSEYKAKEIIKHFKNKIKLEQLRYNYYFSDYKILKEKGISGEVWKNIDGKLVSLF
jgi:hypothetical protein